MVIRNVVLLLKVIVVIVYSRGFIKNNGVKFVIYVLFLGYLILCFIIYICILKFYEGIKNLWIKIEKKNVFLLCFFFELECFMLMFDVDICSK